MATKKKEDTDLGELLKELAKNWPIMVPIMLLAGIIGVFVAMWVRPVYQVDALLQIESKNNKPSGMMGSLGALFATSSPAETEMELIKSRQVMGAAVEKMRLDLVADPQSKIDRLMHKEGRLELSNFSVPWDKVAAESRNKPWTVVAKDSEGIVLGKPIIFPMQETRPPSAFSVPMSEQGKPSWSPSSSVSKPSKNSAEHSAFPKKARKPEFLNFLTRMFTPIAPLKS